MAGERTQSVGARKTVTVLFADLVESTAMSESLDPEVLAGRLATYFERMRSIIESHGGTVEKFIGDAVVGIFGVPVLHEDDALRAVRASVEMQAATTDLNLHSRIGIYTGEVVAGVSGGTSVALGHPVNMAARLQQAADPDTILMGQSTQALLDGRVQAQELGPLSVKGSTEPIIAWLVEGLMDSAPRGWHGRTPFVGRLGEVAAVELAFESAVRDNSCVLLTVVAPPGMGKSRLASEATARLANRARVAVGRCTPYWRGNCRRAGHRHHWSAPGGGGKRGARGGAQSRGRRPTGPCSTSRARRRDGAELARGNGLGIPPLAGSHGEHRSDSRGLRRHSLGRLIAPRSDRLRGDLLGRLSTAADLPGQALTFSTAGPTGRAADQTARRSGYSR